MTDFGVDRLTAVCTGCRQVRWIGREHVCGRTVPGVLAPRPRPFSPCHGAVLDGGPVVFRCASCGRDVHGSVLDGAA